MKNLIAKLKKLKKAIDDDFDKYEKDYNEYLESMTPEERSEFLMRESYFRDFRDMMRW